MPTNNLVQLKWPDITEAHAAAAAAATAAAVVLQTALEHFCHKGIQGE